MGGGCLSKPKREGQEVKLINVTRVQFRWRIVDNHGPESSDAFISEKWEDLEMVALANGRDFLEHESYLTAEAKVDMEVKIDTRTL
jgi:hypothetical protein